MSIVNLGRPLVIRIGIDRQIFAIQSHGGMSRYFSDLYLGLHKQADINIELLFTRHQNAYLHDSGIGRRLRPSQAKAYIKAMSVANWDVNLSKHVDIQHSTYYLGRPKKANSRVHLVSTLHDMTPELIPEYFKSNPHANKLEWFKESCLIISVSDTSASDLAYLRPELAKKIRRIHLYSGFDLMSPQRKPVLSPDFQNPYFLFVGRREGYKNASSLLRAFASSQPALHGHKLLFAGGGSLSLREKEEIDRLRLSSYVVHVGVSDPELWYLYRNASAVLVPSLAEGFSLPLVEGLAADVPVICSDIPVHREVARDYAQLINPLQHDDWADALRAVEIAPKPSSALGIQLFSEKVNYFSRGRMLDEHFQAYKSLVT
jgi:glycosyltransferase involved in cell wall biosynthesis